MEPGALIAERYRIVRQLASGGQAAVYLAQQEPLGRQVALKLLTPPANANDQERRLFENRFQREARTLAGLDHPNIVVIYDYGSSDDDTYYIAMEYIDGVRFDVLLEDGPMAQGRALHLIAEVCAALQYAHAQKVVHRDIKHSNVLVRKRDGVEQVKVVDFGIAKMMEEETGLTLTGVVLGSPHFMAPEQARGSKLSHLVDVYAVGVLLYRSLVGHYPFDGDSFHKIVFGHLGKEIPPFRDLSPALRIHPELEAVVRRCLAKSPEQRFASVGDLLDALAPFLAGASQNPPLVAQPGGGLNPKGPPASVGMSEGMPWWALPLGIGVVAFAVTAIGLFVLAVIVLTMT